MTGREALGAAPGKQGAHGAHSIDDRWAVMELMWCSLTPNCSLACRT